MKKGLLFTVITIILFCQAYSQDTTNIDVVSNNSSSENIKVENGLTASAAYKMLYENSKESNDRMLFTLQWAIGLAVGILLAIIGSQIFFNYRINKREIDKIRADLHNMVLDIENKLKHNMDGERQTIKVDFKEQLKVITDNSKRAIEAEFEKRSKIAEMEEKMFKVEYTNLVKRLEIEIKKNSGDIWILKGVESNALSSFITVAEKQIAIESDAKYTLDDIEKILKGLSEIHSSDYDALNELMATLPYKLRAYKTKLVKLYKDKPVYKYEDKPSLGNTLGIGLGVGNILGLPVKVYVKNKPEGDYQM